MTNIEAAEKALIHAIRSADEGGEIDDAEIHRLAVRVVTGGKTHAELREQLAKRIDVRVPIEISQLLPFTDERLAKETRAHGEIMARAAARNRAIMQGIALLVIGAAGAASGGGLSAALPLIKPLVGQLLDLGGIGGGDASDA